MRWIVGIIVAAFLVSDDESRKEGRDFIQRIAPYAGGFAILLFILMFVPKFW